MQTLPQTKWTPSCQHHNLTTSMTSTSQIAESDLNIWKFWGLRFCFVFFSQAHLAAHTVLLGWQCHQNLPVPQGGCCVWANGLCQFTFALISRARVSQQYITPRQSIPFISTAISFKVMADWCVFNPSLCECAYGLYILALEYCFV